MVCTRCAVAYTYGTLTMYDRYIYKTFPAVYRLPLAVTEANADSLAVTEALHTLCDQPWHAGDGRTIIHI